MPCSRAAVGEILKAGANPHITGLDGKTPLEICTKDELKVMLTEAMGKKVAV